MSAKHHGWQKQEQPQGCRECSEEGVKTKSLKARQNCGGTVISCSDEGSCLVNPAAFNLKDARFHNHSQLKTRRLKHLTHQEGAGTRAYSAGNRQHASVDVRHLPLTLEQADCHRLHRAQGPAVCQLQPATWITVNSKLEPVSVAR